jgi:hypothetical protein
MTFRFAGAGAQVCKSCKFVVARTDRDLAAVGRVADLVDIPSPLQVGTTGRWNGEPFVVDGRVQLDRAGAPGAPWQEFFIAFPQSGRWCWVASAQGRWYATSEAPLPPNGLPPLASLRPGGPVYLGGHSSWTVAEVGQRRVISGEGELPHVAAPGAGTPFADIAGPDGAFGTIDYGDGRSLPPRLYLGRQIDPAVMQLDSGALVEATEAKVAALACPSCGGNLPIVAPGTTERIVCRYCGMASDLRSGALVALRPAPRPPVEPQIPLGQQGLLRGNRVMCIAFLVRGCTVAGERYRWREYLLYAGPRVGYLWLMEEDGAWKLVTPIPPGEVQQHGGRVQYRGRFYHQKQSNLAQVEHVVGEVYWKVEIGEEVRATDHQGPGGIVSVETGRTEVQTSFCEPIAWNEIAGALGLPAGLSSPFAGLGSGGGGADGSTPGASCGTIAIVVIVIFIFIVLAMLDDCGGGGFIGPSFGGGK